MGKIHRCLEDAIAKIVEEQRNQVNDGGGFDDVWVCEIGRYMSVSECRINDRWFFILMFV